MFALSCQRSPTVAAHNSFHLKLLANVRNCWQRSPEWNATQSSHLVYLNICMNYQTCGNLSSIGRRNSEIIMEGKTLLCAFKCLIARPQILNLRPQNQNHGKITSFLKTTSFQREPAAHCFTLSTSPHYSIPSKVLCLKLFWVFNNSVHCL